VSNTRYSELYRLDPEQVKRGTTLAQILDYCRQRGTHFAAEPEAHLTAEAGNPRETLELEDGRIMSISRRIMSDGGWLTTHEDITERAQNERRISYLAQHDVLTGLANRAVFTDKLADASKRLKRHGTGFTVLMLDLDRFKAVNDTLGHAAGDQLLIEVAARLRASLRETDVLARLGGDEFAIIQDGDGDESHHGAIIVARRIIDLIGKPFDLDGHLVNVGMSIGIAFAPEHGAEPDGLLKCADLALYATKAAGRNDFRMFGSEMAGAQQQTGPDGVRAPPLAPSDAEPAPEAASRSSTPTR
jgi:diguanylate cyclase (GGDEF)-like protein